MQDVYAVIMAGGSGTRFWPLSRRAWPKQFLSLAEQNESLLQATVRRIRGLVPNERILVVTSDRHSQATRQQLPELPPENVLAEPSARNTAPCVAWAAAHVSARAPQAVMMVLPADPHIGDEPAYRELLTRACSAAADGGLVTIGVTPTRPETGYGYIECGAELSAGVSKVQRFVEKPDLARAKEFVGDKRFLWNSGMFFFRADHVLDEYQRQLPDLFAFASAYREQTSAHAAESFVSARYGELTSVSIDHGIMEHAQDVRVVPGSFGWYDIGSWTTAWELASKDEQGNAVLAETSLVDAKNCYVRANPGKLVALIGVEDLVVVDTEDALLIMPRERAQDVRRVVDDLGKRDAKKYL
ncbi:MAG TPA: mannose-1-phosphate guanylyltransferase [Polyangiales bacterium]|nr:mannose-1-phosphate guanylyltransferase [Polyangiales bacterium]